MLHHSSVKINYTFLKLCENLFGELTPQLHTPKNKCDKFAELLQMATFAVRFFENTERWVSG
jgi:hypothetical protein